MVTGGWLLTATVLAVTSATLAVQLPSYLYRQSGRDSPLKIRPKPCINARGQKGQCMFVWDCIKGEGKHLGTCVDGFLFGSCCGHDVHHNVLGDKLKPASVTAAASLPLQNNYSAAAVVEMMNEQIEVLREGIVNVSGTVMAAEDDSASSVYTKTPQKWTSSVSAMLHMSTGNESISGASNLNPEWTTQATSTTLHLILPSVTVSRPSTASTPTTTTTTTITTTTTPATTPTTITTTTTRMTTTRTTTTQATTITTPTTQVTTTTVAPTTTTKKAMTTTVTMPSTTASMERRTMEAIESPVIVPSKVFHDCGKPAMLPQMRIVGGKDSRFGAWPWQVSVRRSTYFGFSSTHRCGGAVLNENWIATAGHCVADLLLAQIRIRVGEYDLSSTDEPQPFVERSVQKKVVHPKYNPDTYEYDLALVRLDKPLSPAENIGPICLPAGDPLLIGDSATITGWGRLKEGGTLPSVLQEVKVPIVSNKKCEQMFLATGRREKIPNFFICAGFEKGGKDSCQGDSGGPLQLKADDGRWILAGIISWGIGCGEPNLPGVCTRISKFREWILNKVDKEGA